MQKVSRESGLSKDHLCLSRGFLMETLHTHEYEIPLARVDHGEGPQVSTFLISAFVLKGSHIQYEEFKANFCGREKEGHFHYKNFLRALK